jgi:hypothetical protein
VEHEAVVPAFNPVQDHVQGPEPLTEVAVPAEQRLVLGAEERLAPLLLPQTPLTDKLAEQAVEEVLVPPLAPLQPQVQGPEPLTEVAVPVAQRFVVGAE